MISRLQQAFKRHRLAIPQLILGKMLAKFVRTETLLVFCHDPEARPSALPHHEPALHILQMDSLAPESLLHLSQKYPHKNFAERLRREGQQCIVAMRNGAIAGYAWATNRDLYIDEIARIYPVASNELFIYDCFVDAEHRGAGIYPAMLNALVQANRSKSELKRICIAASSLNQASIRGILKAGFVRQRKIHYLEYRQKQRWWGLDTVDAASRGHVAK